LILIRKYQRKELKSKILFKIKKIKIKIKIKIKDQKNKEEKMI